MKILSVLALPILLIPWAAAADLVLTTWNIDGGQKSDAALRANATAMAAEIGTPDVLVVQEVISEEQVAAVADALGLSHWAISDFSPPVSITGAWPHSLEVAVVSRLPIQAVGEWDTTGREPNGDGYIPRISSPNIPAEELEVRLPAGHDAPSRGFLRVDLQDGPTVYAVHWKSSRGQSCNLADLGYAREREAQAAGLVADATGALADGRTMIVAGDFNIQAPGRVSRVGTDPSEDCAPNGSCEGVCGVGVADGYDDSIHVLLQAGQGAALLSADLPETYIGGTFPGGAIDHILVAGPGVPAFGTAETPEMVGTDYHGSDHRPVFVAWGSGADRLSEKRPRLEELLEQIRERLQEIEQLAQ